MKWAAAILSVGLILASCSSDPKPAAPAPTATTAAAAAPTGAPAISPATSIGATLTTGAFGSTHSAACDTDLTALETAVEAYLAINGGQDVTEAQLVQAGLLREESTLHDIGLHGSVIPSSTGGCAS